MNAPLLDAFRHSAWANRELLAFCHGLSDTQLDARVDGSYGSILETLKHILGAEAYYSFVFNGQLPEWDDWDNPSLDAMGRWAVEMASFWETLLAQPLDPDEFLVREHEDGQRVKRAPVSSWPRPYIMAMFTANRSVRS
jgi:uncharacterized damage-inducible protein DinB